MTVDGDLGGFGAALTKTAQAAAEADVGDDQGDAAGAARRPLEVGADRADVEQQPLDRRGDRRLADRLGDGAVADHQPVDTDREVAAHRVHTRVEAGHATARARRWSTAATRSSSVPAPGATASACAPTDGVVR